MIGWLKRALGLEGGTGRIVVLTGGLSEPEAELYRGLLDDNGIPAMVRDPGALASQGGAAERTFQVLVQARDLERAQSLLRLSKQE